MFDPETGSRGDAGVLHEVLRGIPDSGFWTIDVPGELGGTVAPPSLKWAMNEMVLGANPAIAMFAASYSFAKLLYILGNDDQKKLARWIIEKGWHCTMVLTEPDAGSDVGAGRTKAVQNEDGTWSIIGVKRFITSAESDMVDNVVHFVLARPEGAGPGTKGLSLFIVPKFHVDLETGELGARNGAVDHQPREEDGPQGLDDVRDHLRREAARRRHPRSATSTTASPRCSASSSTPGCSSAPRPSPPCPRATSTRSSTPRSASRAPTSPR